jgi:polyisoprenoid-binding protein YceI
MSTATATASKTWAIDPMHTEVSFKVRHLMISTVTGWFREFEGKVEGEKENFSDATIHFAAKVASVDTGNEQRDGHLKSPDFFDADQFETLEFNSTNMVKKGDDYLLEGELRIKDVTKEITLQVEYFGTQIDPYGNTKAGFEVKGKINRKDFGLTWSATTETGGVVVSDEVKIIANVQLALQKD